MTKEAFIIGCPVEFKKLCLIYPPTVKEVVCNPEYDAFNKILTLSQEEIEDEFVEHNKDLKYLLTPFEYILNGAYNDSHFKLVLEQAFAFYIHEPVYILPEQKQVLLGDIKGIKSIHNLRILKEEDYFEFQNLIREASGEEPKEPPNPNEDPRIKAIKAKARYRDKIKAKKGKGITRATLIASISCMQMGLNPLNIGELSYAALPILVATYQEKEKYQLDVESLLAGADSKKVKPKYWIRNLEN